jgi:hypothetical protein
MEENKPVINVKRFSRSKKVESESIEEPVKKTRGRKKKVIINEDPVIEDPVIEEPIIDEPVIEEDIPELESFEVDNDFLSELNNSNYQKEIEEEDILKEQIKEKEREAKELMKEREKRQKEFEKEQARLIKERDKHTEKVNKKIVDSDNDLYSEGAIIQGPDKIKLIHKVKQYKNLFSDIPEIKSFKIKPNASEAELKNYIIELETLSSISSVDAFLTDSILQCIKLVEGPTARTKNFNITGLSDLLKSNKQFHTLCKKLYLKYNCFDALPPEYQLIMLVATTSYICINKNKGKNELDAYLNETIELKK